MDESHVNRRTTMTKRLLKDSLIELMKKKPIHNISIKDVCERADVNRSTFYRHYNTQFDLYNEIVEDIYRDIVSVTDQYTNTIEKREQIMTEILTYVEEHRELCMTILGTNGNLNIGETFATLIKRVLERNKPEGLAGPLEAYVVQFISAGLASIIWTWLNEEPRMSPRELSKIVNLLVVHGIRRATKLF